MFIRCVMPCRSMMSVVITVNGHIADTLGLPHCRLPAVACVTDGRCVTATDTAVLTRPLLSHNWRSDTATATDAVVTILFSFNLQFSPNIWQFSAVLIFFRQSFNVTIASTGLSQRNTTCPYFNIRISLNFSTIWKTYLADVFQHIELQQKPPAEHFTVV